MDNSVKKSVLVMSLIGSLLFCPRETSTITTENVQDICDASYATLGTVSGALMSVAGYEVLKAGIKFWSHYKNQFESEYKNLAHIIRVLNPNSDFLSLDWRSTRRGGMQFGCGAGMVGGLMLGIGLYLVYDSYTEFYRLYKKYTAKATDDTAIMQKALDELTDHVITLMYNDITLLKKVRYALYGTQEIYTPLDRIIDDMSALCNFYKLLIINNSSWDQATQMLINRIEPSQKSITMHDIATVFAEHNETLRSYRSQEQSESQQEIGKVLDQIINDFSAFEVYLAL